MAILICYNHVIGLLYLPRRAMCEKESVAIEYNNIAANECIPPVKVIFVAQRTFDLGKLLENGARL